MVRVRELFQLWEMDGAPAEEGASRPVKVLAEAAAATRTIIAMTCAVAFAKTVANAFAARGAANPAQQRAQRD